MLSHLKITIYGPKVLFTNLMGLEDVMQMNLNSYSDLPPPKISCFSIFPPVGLLPLLSSLCYGLGADYIPRPPICDVRPAHYHSMVPHL